MAGRGSRSSTDILTQRAPHVEVHRGLGCKERTHRQEKQERRKEEMEKGGSHPAGEGSQSERQSQEEPPRQRERLGEKAQSGGPAVWKDAESPAVALRRVLQGCALPCPLPLVSPKLAAPMGLLPKGASLEKHCSPWLCLGHSCPEALAPQSKGWCLKIIHPRVTPGKPLP